MDGDDAHSLMVARVAIIATVVTIVAAILLGFCSFARADECLSRGAARKASPEGHLSYSGRVEGHKGAHCWFGSDSERKVMPTEPVKIRRTTLPHATRPRSASLPAGARPSPAPVDALSSYAVPEVVLPSLDRWIASVLEEPGVSFSARFDAVLSATP